jgi:hypothetical protein
LSYFCLSDYSSFTYIELLEVGKSEGTLFRSLFRDRIAAWKRVSGPSVLPPKKYFSSALIPGRICDPHVCILSFLPFLAIYFYFSCSQFLLVCIFFTSTYTTNSFGLLAPSMLGVLPGLALFSR